MRPYLKTSHEVVLIALSEWLLSTLNKASSLIVNYGLKVLFALLILIIGFRIIRSVGKGLERMMKKRKVDPTLRPFFQKLLVITLKVLLLISIAGMVGIQVTSFVAILGAAGLAVGLALQGSLANFAGGVLILLFKPFVVGDYIKAQGEEGTVKMIDIFHTHLTTIDNRVIILPNGPLANGNIVNFTKEPLRRLDLEFGISYDDDIDKARSVLEMLVKKDVRALKKPSPEVLVTTLGDNSVTLLLRVWVQGKDYWPFRFSLIEAVKKTFDQEGLHFPYQQLDVHLDK